MNEFEMALRITDLEEENDQLRLENEILQDKLNKLSNSMNDYEIITLPEKLRFHCYHCGSNYRASYKHYYKTQTGYGCKCPFCDYASFTK